MAFWAVATTKPSSEKRALRHLGWRGYAAYAPREKVVRVYHGRKLNTHRWLFPNYIFVWISDQWYDLFSTIGISRVLMSGDQPAQMPAGWVEDMKAREQNGALVLPPRFKLGQAVTITSGFFAGARGLYQGMTTRQREVVLLDVLGRVELASGHLD